MKKNLLALCFVLMLVTVAYAATTVTSPVKPVAVSLDTLKTAFALPEDAVLSAFSGSAKIQFLTKGGPLTLTLQFAKGKDGGLLIIGQQEVTSK